MTGFTRGPWRDFRDAYGDGLFIDTAFGTDSNNGMVIAGQIHGTHREANARLIAAAPELLAAVDGLLSVIASGGKGFADAVHIEQAKKARAKARGEA